MSFPFSPEVDPRQIARSATMATWFQDIVVACTKVVHEQPLEPADRDALKRCRAMLAGATRSGRLVGNSGLDQLAKDSETLAAIRQATPKDEETEAFFSESANALGRILAGRPSAQVHDRIKRVRDTFVVVGQLSLAASLREQERETSLTWTPTSASLSS